MRNIIFILITLFVFSCKAQQQTFPLNTYAESVPVNSYFKDLNNELDFYTGTWVATFQDKSITLKIVKQAKQPIEFFNKNYYRDQLFVRYEVKKNGVILESTLDKNFTNDSKLSLDGANPEENGNKVTLVFAGGNCSVGIGTIVFKKKNSTQLYWGYYPGTTTRIDTLCPPNNDYSIYLPETENLVFTKQ